jgi:hypothetical protein
MSFSKHPAIELQLEYRDGLCSSGAALAVATHLALCPQCQKMRPLGPWGGRNLPSILASDHGQEGGAYASALGSTVLEDWREANGGVRFAALKRTSSIGEAVHLIEAEAGAPMTLPRAPLFVVVLQGMLTNGFAFFERGAFIDLTAPRLPALMIAGSCGSICLAISETR